jgi:cell division protein FtsQ
VSTASVVLPRRRARIRILRRRLLLAMTLAVAALLAYLLWFRDSSLVAVKAVRVDGVGRSAVEREIAGALRRAGLGMTTLHVRRAALQDAVRQYPLVESVSASADFPSALTVHVTERRPVALIEATSGTVAVSGDGTLLRGVPAEGLRLPRLPLSEPPKARRLRGPVAEQAAVLGGAPRALLRYVDHTFSGPSGVGVQLSGGVYLLFGGAGHAVAKWRAAAAVLSDPHLGALDYVDLTVPGRPAVGGVGHSPPPIASG